MWSQSGKWKDKQVYIEERTTASYQVYRNHPHGEITQSLTICTPLKSPSASACMVWVDLAQVKKKGRKVRHTYILAEKLGFGRSCAQRLSTFIL